VSLFNAGGTPTLAESMSTGSASFVASVSETVTFTIEQPDDNYLVLLDVPTVLVRAAVTNRTSSDFTIDTDVAFTGTIDFTVVRK
jgi:hypothetical protein